MILGLQFYIQKRVYLYDIEWLHGIYYTQCMKIQQKTWQFNIGKEGCSELCATQLLVQLLNVEDLKIQYIIGLPRCFKFDDIYNYYYKNHLG